MLEDIFKNYNGKNFYNQANDSDIKRCEEIRKLTTGQGQDYASGCSLEFDYIKNIYRLIAVDLSRQEELNTDLNAVQQIEFIGQLKKLDHDGNATDAGNDQSMFVLTILEKITETRLKFSQGSVTVL